MRGTAMMPIQLLIEHRSAILEQAKRYGINELYATRALSPTRCQCFLFEMEAGTTEEQIKTFNKTIKTITGFNEEIILLNRQTFIGLIDYQSDEQQPAFKEVLNSAKRLEELDERPLEQQLEEQAREFQEMLKIRP